MNDNKQVRKLSQGNKSETRDIRFKFALLPQIARVSYLGVNIKIMR